MKTNIFAAKLENCFNRMIKFDTEQNQIAVEHEEFLDDSGRQLFPYTSFSQELNLNGANSQISLVLPNPLLTLDPKASAILAQQYVNSNDFLTQLGDLVESPSLCFILSIKANVLSGNLVQFASIRPAAVKHIIKFFTKKTPFLRRRGAKRRGGQLYIKRFRFITTSELVRFFIWRRGYTFFDEQISKISFKEFVSFVKSLKLIVVKI